MIDKHNFSSYLCHELEIFLFEKKYLCKLTGNKMYFIY